MAGRSAKVSAKTLIFKTQFTPILTKKGALLPGVHFTGKTNSLKSIRGTISSQTTAMAGLRDFYLTGQQPILPQRHPKY
jgi:hypothetical protein